VEPASSPMRVLITSPVFPPDLGGPSVYVPSFGRFMVERGHHVEVVAFCSDPDPQGYPFTIHAISRGRLPVRYLKAFVEVWKQAKGVDVVYVQEHLALLHVLAAKLRGVPVVIRIMVDGAWEISHRKGWIDGDNIVVFETKTYGFKVKLTRFLQKRWWNWCTRLISCSEFLRQICVQRYGLPGDKVVKIFNAYHGQPPDEAPATRELACEQLGLDPSKRYVLTICRLMVWKGVDGILRAMRELPDDAVLLIAGDGDMEEEWKRLAGELGLGDRARFLGNVPHAQIPAYIRAADVFVLNSEYEGLSHTLIEVAALGTATVCTGVCGNPEVVEDGVHGFCVPPKDHVALADAIGKLLADKELRERFAARARADSGRFSREETFARVEQVLTEAAGR
jgi:glycosyltransferase involved in cell wall biosynthesis